METGKQFDTSVISQDMQQRNDPTFPDRVAYVFECIQNNFGKNPNGLRILDFGACVAEISEQVRSKFSNNDYTIFEICSEFHPIIKEKGFSCITTYEDLVKTKKYDVIIFCECIEHILDVDTAMSAIEKITKENSIVILTTPDSSWYLAALRILCGRYERWFCNPFDSHIRFFTFGSLIRLFRKYRFGVVMMRHYRKLRFGVFSIYACFSKGA